MEKYLLDSIKLQNGHEIEVNNNGFYLITKRIIDIILSLIGIIITFIPMLIVAICIKMEDPKGPIFFSQNRCGVNGEIFKMYKFRSMYVNAENMLDKLQELNEMDGPVFKIKDDPRITKVGRVLRKTSVDELPQLVNVLKGQMSIVGPRPALPEEVKQYNDYQKQRLLVKPGITCIWQISGRNTIGFSEWVELDIKYIKERNLLVDLVLILKTIPVLLGDKNAS
ncbi:sugar transferase [Turicibacter sanguinis]|uniref:sugar transferase n=1 Tax=Turicibacter sanguinis TaxID=154288 RepID=UPI0018A8AB70|nr:sugar transferase [Turicibacter sanguinis]MDB8553974.1 sugar transferase [Turicibacter sanguinis]